MHSSVITINYQNNLFISQCTIVRSSVLTFELSGSKHSSIYLFHKVHPRSLFRESKSCMYVSMYSGNFEFTDEHNVHRCGVGWGSDMKGNRSYLAFHGAHCTFYKPPDGHREGRQRTSLQRGTSHIPSHASPPQILTSPHSRLPPGRENPETLLKLERSQSLQAC